jgi:hypothetical protein
MELVLHWEQLIELPLCSHEDGMSLETILDTKVSMADGSGLAVILGIYIVCMQARSIGTIMHIFFASF